MRSCGKYPNADTAALSTCEIIPVAVWRIVNFALLCDSSSSDTTNKRKLFINI